MHGSRCNAGCLLLPGSSLPLAVYKLGISCSGCRPFICQALAEILGVCVEGASTDQALCWNQQT